MRKRLKGGMSLKAICEAMCDACLAPDLKGLCRCELVSYYVIACIHIT